MREKKIWFFRDQCLMWWVFILCCCFRKNICLSRKMFFSSVFTSTNLAKWQFYYLFSFLCQFLFFSNNSHFPFHLFGKSNVMDFVPIPTYLLSRNHWERERKIKLKTYDQCSYNSCVIFHIKWNRHEASTLMRIRSKITHTNKLDILWYLFTSVLLFAVYFEIIWSIQKRWPEVKMIVAVAVVVFVCELVYIRTSKENRITHVSLLKIEAYVVMAIHAFFQISYLYLLFLLPLNKYMEWKCQCIRQIDTHEHENGNEKQ